MKVPSLAAEKMRTQKTTSGRLHVSSQLHRVATRLDTCERRLATSRFRYLRPRRRWVNEGARETSLDLECEAPFHEWHRPDCAASVAAQRPSTRRSGRALAALRAWLCRSRGSVGFAGQLPRAMPTCRAVPTREIPAAQTALTSPSARARLLQWARSSPRATRFDSIRQSSSGHGRSHLSNNDVR